MDHRIRQLPPFDADVVSWFQHIEAAFVAFPDITDDQKYHAIVTAIPTAIAARIAPTLSALPNEGKYLAVKKALLRALGQTREYHLHALEEVRYDGGRPSLLLQRLQALNAAAEDPYSAEMLRFRWLALLPTSLRVLLATSSSNTLQECGHLADSIFFAQRLQPVPPDRVQNASVSSLCGASTPASVTVSSAPFPLNPQCSVSAFPYPAMQGVMPPVYSVRYANGAPTPARVSEDNVYSPLNSSHSDSVLTDPALLGAVSLPRAAPSTSVPASERLEARLSALEVSLEKLHSSRAAFPSRQTPQYCYYHRRFGEAARNCESPCTWSGNGRRGGR